MSDITTVPEAGRAASERARDVLSLRTKTTLAVGTIAIAASVFSALARPFGDSSDEVGYAIALIMLIASAGLLFWTACSYRRGDKVRTQWLLVAGGVLASAIGDITYVAVALVASRQVSFPNVSDAFYLIQYVVLAWAFVLAIRAYSAFVDMRRLTLQAFAGSALLWVVLFGAIGVTVLWTSEELPFKVAAVWFTTMNVFALVMPAILAMLVFRTVGVARFAWPWRAATIAAIAFALTDTANYAFSGFQGSLDFGFIMVGAGRMLYALMLAFAAMVSRDVYAMR